MAAKVRPLQYIRFASTVITACYVLVFVSMFKPYLLEPVIVPVGIFNLVGNMVLALGYLGENGVEVSEVSAHYHWY